MMVTSVCSPGVFAGEQLKDAKTLALARDRLKHMAFCHYWICDKQGTLHAQLRGLLSKLPQSLANMIGESIAGNSMRIVRLAQPQPMPGIQDELANEPGSALAIAFAGGTGVDVCFVTEDGFTAAELAGCATKKLATFATYGDTDISAVEYRSMGGLCLGGMHQDKFATQIIGPVLRWSDKVQLFDRNIGRAFGGVYANEMEQGRNWTHFVRTIGFIYNTWEAKCLRKHNSFEVITAPPPDKEPAGGMTQWIDALGRSLNLGEYGRVKLISTRDHEVRHLAHDRYLVTNRNVVLNFTRGFDLIEPNGYLRDCTVCLCRHGRSDELSQLLGARPTYEWPPDKERRS